MSSVGPQTGTTFSNLANGGSTDKAWTSPGNAQTSDNIRSTVSLATLEDTKYLTAVGFDFSAIATGSTIDGIVLSVEKRASINTALNYVTDLSVVLLKAGTPTGEKADAVTQWSTTDTVVNYGGSSDLWGDTWSVADIQDANFGGGIAAIGVTTAVIVPGVDQITMTVYYTPPPSKGGTLLLMGVG